jgi:ribosomal protein S27AE
MWGFIFIGGVQPRKRRVDDQPRTCPSCGLPSARLKRLDYYISLFFIPLIPIKQGEQFLECERCGGVFSETGEVKREAYPRVSSETCPRCGDVVDPGFRYCPHCGQQLP